MDSKVNNEDCGVRKYLICCKRVNTVEKQWTMLCWLDPFSRVRFAKRLRFQVWPTDILLWYETWSDLCRLPCTCYSQDLRCQNMIVTRPPDRDRGLEMSSVYAYTCSSKSKSLKVCLIDSDFWSVFVESPCTRQWTPSYTRFFFFWKRCFFNLELPSQDRSGNGTIFMHEFTPHSFQRTENIVEEDGWRGQEGHLVSDGGFF